METIKMTELFNFYVEKETKEAAQNKIAEFLPGHKKGLTASLLRILLIQFLNTEPSQDLINAVEADYQYYASKNKRGVTKL